MTGKHSTASVYIYALDNEQLHICLLLHKRLRKWMVPGGHVEQQETAAEAATREVREETGLAVQLTQHDPLALGSTYPHPSEPAPWLVSLLPVPPDDYDRDQHIHVDHVFSALLPGLRTSHTGEYAFSWQTVNTLDDIDMFEDSRVIAKSLAHRLTQAGSFD